MKVEAGTEKKGGRGRRRGDEETLARKPHDFGKRPLIFHGSVHLVHLVRSISFHFGSFPLPLPSLLQEINTLSIQISILNEQENFNSVCPPR